MTWRKMLNAIIFGRPAAASGTNCPSGTHPDHCEPRLAFMPDWSGIFERIWAVLVAEPKSARSVGVKKPVRARCWARLDIRAAKTQILTDGQRRTSLVIDSHPGEQLPDANAGPCRWNGGRSLRSPAGRGHPRKRPEPCWIGGPAALMTKRSGRTLRNPRGSTRSWPSGRTPHGSGHGCVSLGGGANDQSWLSISSAGSVCVTIAATISIKGSVTWPKSSSLSGSWTCMVLLRVHHWAGLF